MGCQKGFERCSHFFYLGDFLWRRGKQFSLRVYWGTCGKDGRCWTGRKYLTSTWQCSASPFLPETYPLSLCWFFHVCTFSDFFFTFPADSETPTPIFSIGNLFRSSWVLLEVPWICWSSKWIWLGGGRFFLGNLVVATFEQWSKPVVICCHNRGMTLYLVTWGFWWRLEGSPWTHRLLVDVLVHLRHWLI